MKNCLCVFIAILIGHCQAWAQITFSNYDGPSGSSVGDIEMNASGHIFAMVASQQPIKPSSGSVYRSIDNGANWTKLSIGTNGLNDRDAYDILVDASNNIYVVGKFKIYKSTAASNGDAWTSFTPASPYVGSGALAKTTAGSLYSQTLDKVFRSTDDGATWSLVIGGLPSTQFSTIIASGNDVYLGVLNSGTYKLTNNGSSWAVFNTGLTLPDQAASFAVKGTTIYQTNRNGAYYYNTVGSTWTLIASQGAVAPNTLNEVFNNSDHIIRNGTLNRLFIAFKNGNVYTSSNATAGPWTNIGLNLGDNTYSFNVFTTDVYAGYSREGIRKTSDLGVNWLDVDNGIYLNSATSFVRASVTNKLIITNGGPRVSFSDFGSSWTKSYLNACTACSFSTLRKLSNGNILAIGNETYKSIDNGNSWSDVGGPPVGVVLRQAVSGDETKFYGFKNNGTTSTFYVSTNAAVSFSTLAVTGLPASYDTRRIVADASNNLYILLYNNSNGKQEVYKVVNAATVANAITNTGFTEIYNIQSLGSAIYIGGRNASNTQQLALSANGGTSWSFVNVPSFSDFLVVSANVIFSFENNSNVGTYSFSNDAGATWSPAFTEAFDSRLVGGIIDTNGFVILALANGPMYTSDQPVLKPATPINLQAIATGENTVYLTWDHDGLFTDHFNIERRLQSAVPFDSIGNEDFSERYHKNQGLTKNTAYVYRIVAVGEAGISYSSELTVTTKDDCVLTIPDNRSWTGTVPGGFTNAAIGIRKFNNDQYLITDFTAGSLAGVARNSGGTFGMATVSTYVYQNCLLPFINDAQSVYPNGNGSWNGTTLVLNFQIDKTQYTPTSKTITLTLNPAVLEPPPLLPVNPVAYVFDNSSIQLEWQADLYQNKYLIFRSTTSGGVFTQVGTVDYPTLTFRDNTSLVAGTTYYYKLKSQNINLVQSAFTAELTVAFNNPKFVLAQNVVTSTAVNAATAVWADFNNDDLVDLLMPTLGTSGSTTNEPALFQNTGTDFTLLTGKFPAGENYVSPTVGDFDNDGLLDVYMTTLGINNNEPPTKNSLFRNTGNFNFTEITTNPLLSTVAGEDGAFNSSWVDFNLDGKLDLFVANQSSGSQLLLRGDGAGGFTKVTGDPLVTDAKSNGDAGWADYDNNGTPDVVIVSAEGTDASRLFKNTAGTFTKVASSGMDGEDAESLFTASWGDYDNDLDLDLFVANQEGVNFLYKNNGNGTFTKVAPAANQPSENVSSSHFSSAWGDIDNDGDLDLFVAGAFGEVNSLYLNQGTSFTKVSGEMITGYTAFNISAAFADYNKDGLLDIAVGQLGFSENEEAAPNIPAIKLFKNNGTPGNWIQIKCVGTASNKAAIGTKIRITAGGKSQMREISSHTGFGSQSSLLVHFGLGSSTKVDDMLVTWPSGSIQHLTNVTKNQILTLVEDGAAPLVTVYNPANGATNALATTLIELTFDEPPVPVAGKKISLVVNGTASPGFPMNVTDGTIVGNKITFTPPSPLISVQSYTVTVEAGAFTDAFDHPTPLITWSFVTIDGVAPVITFTPPAKVDKGFGNKSVSASITDEGLIVSSARLSYRKIGGGTFDHVDGVPDAVVADQFNFTIQESFFDAMGLEYFITAKDPANNEGRLPVDVNENFYTYLGYPEALSIIPSSVLGLGGQKTSWKVFTIPFDLGASNGISTVLDELGADINDKTKVRMLTYVDDVAWGEFPSFSTFTRGKGYFINIRTAPLVALTIGDVVAPANNRKTLFPLVLKKGWNQIGNPYTLPISWADVSTLNALTGTEAKLKKFSGTYAEGTSLLPYEGGFVFMDNDKTILIPFSGQTAVGGRSADVVSSDLGKDYWQVNLHLKQNDITNDLSGIGMHPDALLTKDQFDDINPPRFIDYVEMNFPHHEYFAKNFSMDVVPLQNEFIWDVDVNSNLDGEAELTWDNTAFGINDKELYLFDVAQQKPVDMRSLSRYRFSPKQSTHFRIYYGVNLESKIKPDRVQLGKAFPNPSSGVTSIPFTLPGQTATMRVKLEVYDLLGNKVVTLADGEFAPGFYTAEWNSSGSPMSDGLYVYRMVVADQNKNVVQTGKVVLRK